MKNENFFETIDSEAKAYWLGFLAADGCNHEHKGQVCLSLSEQDGEAVRDFASIFDSKASVWESGDPERQNMVHTTVCSDRVSRDLARWGVVRRKSLILKTSPVSPALFRHYMRGLWDGDGCIHTGWSGKYRHVETFIVGSDDLTKDIEAIMRFGFGLRCTKTRYGKNKVTTTLKISGTNPSLSWLDWLYEGATVFLPRKMAKYQEVVQIKNVERIGDSKPKPRPLPNYEGISDATREVCEAIRHDFPMDETGEVWPQIVPPPRPSAL